MKRRQQLSDWVEEKLDSFELRRANALPEQIHLSVTDRCFLPCLHCDIWKNDAHDIATKKWIEVIDRLGKWCAPAGMNFVGGEPLMRKDLEQLISHATSYGFECSFNTNGWLVTPQRAQALASAGAQIAYVSMDGFEKTTIDRSRGRAAALVPTSTVTTPPAASQNLILQKSILKK